MNMSARSSDLLAPLFAPLTSLPGVGPTVAGLIERAAGGGRVIDLLFHLPESYLDRSARPTIRDARPGTIATLAVEVVRHERPATSRQPWRVVVRDDTGLAELVFFKFTREAQTPPGTRLLVSGKLDVFNHRLTIAHPEHMVPIDQPGRIPLIEPVWPLTGGLWPRQVAAGLAQALAMLPALPEWHDAALLKREKWPTFADALRKVQSPNGSSSESCPKAKCGLGEAQAFSVMAGGAEVVGGPPPRAMTQKNAGRRSDEGHGTTSYHGVTGAEGRGIAEGQGITSRYSVMAGEAEPLCVMAGEAEPLCVMAGAGRPPTSFETGDAKVAGSPPPPASTPGASAHGAAAASIPAVPDKRMRARLAYDELLAGQVAQALIRGRVRARVGQPLMGDSHLRDEALRRFGFAPTPSQMQALSEIDADLASPRRMLRLLQGDVGSGKTLVALLAMLRAVEAGKQAALMAPTEVLAKQHHRTLTKLCPLPVALLTGSIKGRERARLLRGMKDATIKIVVGTHALFQDAVEYHDLALAVIDEQHRFGVTQRLTLGAKGERTDVLVMTATPIPRTLLLTQWGEMDVSRLTDKPPGRQPIRTTLHSLGTLPTVLEAIARKLDEGAQVYWVCPLVAESEALDVAAAQERHAHLKHRFGELVGLAHGQQTPEVRDAALAAFAAGTVRLLVATTVVEVGVDVPEASIMVIEHAERFGLAQLHQLRGRVGRGADASFCLLLHEDWVNESARRRLILLRDTDDGFLIADEDFRLRGSGDALGTRQAGLPGYRLADVTEHEHLLHMAHRDAAVLLSRDPKLETTRGQAIRVLLRLFERTAAMRTLAAG
jgi:ATP-dependent DNA helicase RecG